MFVLAARVDLHVPEAGSLKAKRAAVRPIIEGARHRFGVAAAEVDHHELWQRSEVGFAVVSATEGHAVEVMDAVERFVWSFPEVEVASVQRDWLEVDR
jgi:uncharacterized protein YlxP (DUF503 family)